MIKFSNTVLSKGLFAIAVVAVTGTIGAVNFAQAAENNNVSGYGTIGEQASAAADAFQVGLSSSSNTFAEQVAALSDEARGKLASGTPVNTFDSQFSAATATYEDTTSAAFNDFRTKVTGFANTAESKDQFIDQFNHAKADYLNQLDAAKNQFANSLSPLGDQGNQAKDIFMNGYNADRDAYSNQLEALKNDFAATVSNL